MKNILKNAENAEKLLKLTSDTMILLDKNGICVDIAVYNVDLWFLKEDRLQGKNILQLLPPSTYRQVRPEFEKVLVHRKISIQNYELTIGDKTYFFKCIMRPYEDMVLCQYRDITERSQRKLKLEKNNYELNEIQKAALIGRWRYDSNKTSFGYSGHSGVMCTEEKQEIQLGEYMEYVLPEDRDVFGKWLIRNLQGNLEESVEYRIHYQKQVYYIRLKTFSREIHKNGSTILEGYIQNITDIQQRRNDINLLTHAINNSAEDIFAAHEDGMLVFANRRFRQHHNIGITDDITQINICQLDAYPQGEEGWKKVIASVNKGEEHNGFILPKPLPLHPEVLAMEGNAYWVTSDKGEDILWAFGRDITQRIKNEQQIKRFSQILDKTIENLPAGIVVKDIENGFRYLYRNRESYNRNIPMKEALGKDDFDFYPLDIAQEKRRQDIEIARTGIEKHWIAEEHDQNGKSIFLDKRKMRIDSNDFPPILLSIEWDITEMERMKRELLVAKEKAETSDQLKSAFLANMSHEIRTPLNAIVGFSRIIAESTDAEERKNYYDIVEANNERLLQLINEILDLSKIEAGMVEFTITPVRLHPLCKEIHDALKFRCPLGVELIYEPSEEDIVIEGDKNRIFQVVSNLIGNAFKFTTSGSVSYGYCRKGDEIEFHVSDTGIGIEADKLSKVFERFVKVNSFAQGTGLGLSICKTIIERLGGTISVSSEMGEGTTFIFTLPSPTKKEEVMQTSSELPENNSGVSNATEQRSNPSGSDAESIGVQEPATLKASEELKSPTILVAEDTDSNYILVKAILGKSYHLERAKDGMEAIAMFEELHPELILMDMKMPNLGGLDATKIIRELSPKTPIIALTAYAYEQDKQAAFDVGCNEFLTKPYTQEKLKGLIEKYLK
mgnify:FL=1|jgi:signal transduction histidine kinase